MLYKEIVYQALDELKLQSGDSDFTPEHILFIANNLRAYLLNSKYNKASNTIASENYQELCLDLERANNIEGMPCSEVLLRSVKEIPDTLEFSILNVSPDTALFNKSISMVSFERLQYVGNSKWTFPLIFAARGRDNHLYLRSGNPQFLYLEKVRIYGVFTDPKKIIESGCENCDIMEQRFPIEESLATLLVQSIVQELSGQRYMNKDKVNNASDDMTGMAGATPRNINRQYVQPQQYVQQ